MKNHSAFREVQVTQHGQKGEKHMEGAGNEAKKAGRPGYTKDAWFLPVYGRSQ